MAGLKTSSEMDGLPAALSHLRVSSVSSASASSPPSNALPKTHPAPEQQFKVSFANIVQGGSASKSNLNTHPASSSGASSRSSLTSGPSRRAPGSASDSGMETNSKPPKLVANSNLSAQVTTAASTNTTSNVNAIVNASSEGSSNATSTRVGSATPLANILTYSPGTTLGVAAAVPDFKLDAGVNMMTDGCVNQTLPSPSDSVSTTASATPDPTAIGFGSILAAGTSGAVSNKPGDLPLRGSPHGEIPSNSSFINASLELPKPATFPSVFAYQPRLRTGYADDGTGISEDPLRLASNPESAATDRRSSMDSQSGVSDNGDKEGPNAVVSAVLNSQAPSFVQDTNSMSADAIHAQYFHGSHRGMSVGSTANYRDSVHDQNAYGFAASQQFLPQHQLGTRPSGAGSMNTTPATVGDDPFKAAQLEQSRYQEQHQHQQQQQQHRRHQQQSIHHYVAHQHRGAAMMHDMYGNVYSKSADSQSHAQAAAFRQNFGQRGSEHAHSAAAQVQAQEHMSPPKLTTRSAPHTDSETELGGIALQPITTLGQRHNAASTKGTLPAASHNIAGVPDAASILTENKPLAVDNIQLAQMGQMLEPNVTERRDTHDSAGSAPDAWQRFQPHAQLGHQGVLDPTTGITHYVGADGVSRGAGPYVAGTTPLVLSGIGADGVPMAHAMTQGEYDWLQQQHQMQLLQEQSRAPSAGHQVHNGAPDGMERAFYGANQHRQNRHRHGKHGGYHHGVKNGGMGHRGYRGQNHGRSSHGPAGNRNRHPHRYADDRGNRAHRGDGHGYKGGRHQRRFQSGNGRSGRHRHGQHHGNQHQHARTQDAGSASHRPTGLNSISAFGHLEGKVLTLEHVRGQVVAMSKEQRGCRMLQQAIDRGATDITEQVLAEVRQHLVFLMVDPFGNYLFQKLIEHTDPETWQTQILTSVAPHLIPASLNSHGTRAVQKIIEVCKLPSQVVEITAALRGSIVQLATDSNGNHVVQQCLHHLPLQSLSFIFEEITAEARVVSKHRHGCCVVQRCIDVVSGEQRALLLDVICAHALELMQNAFGNYVVQYMLDHGDKQLGGSGSVRRVVKQVLGNIAMLSQQKYSSNVVEACLKNAEATDLSTMLAEIIQPHVLDALLAHQYGNYVVQQVLMVTSDEQRKKLITAILPYSRVLANHAGGRNILEFIGAHAPLQAPLGSALGPAPLLGHQALAAGGGAASQQQQQAMHLGPPLLPHNSAQPSVLEQ